MLVLSLTMLFFNGYAQVGHTASPSYPTLSSAVAASVLTVTSGVCTDNFTVSGDFEIDMSVKFDGSQIDMNLTGADNILISSDTEFENCDINGMGPLLHGIYSSLGFDLEFDRGTADDLEILNQASDLTISLTELGNCLVTTNSSATTSYIDAVFNSCKSKVVQTSTLTSNLSEFNNVGSIPVLNGMGAINVSGDSDYIGSFNEFNSCAYGVYSDNAPPMAPGIETITENFSTFTNCGIGLNMRFSGSLFAKYNTFRSCDEASRFISCSGEFEFEYNDIFKCGTSVTASDGANVTIFNNNHGLMTNYAVAMNQIINSSISLDSIDITGLPGIALIEVDNTTVDENFLTNTDDHGIRAFDCYELSITENHSKNSDFSALFYDASRQGSVSCNRFETSNFGAEFTGVLGQMDYVDNEMTSNITGLVYNASVVTGPQIDHGNEWYTNGFGAQSSVPPSLIKFQRYIVVNNPIEYPSHTPAAWFDPTSTGGISCVVFPPPEEANQGGEEALLSQINCDGYDEEGGVCLWNKITAFEDIEAQPGLRQNTELDEFYSNHIGTNIDLLPSWSEILGSFVELEYPQYDLVYDSNGSPTNLNEYLEHLQNEIKPRSNQRLQDKLAKIADWRAHVNGISPQNDMESNYLWSVERFLDLMEGIEIDDADKNQIVFNAEQCLDDYGPSTIICKSMAERLDLSYQADPSCIENRGEDGREIIHSALELYPNPTSDYIKVNIPNNEEFSILNSMGATILEGKVENNQIRVDQLNPGMYFLKADHFSMRKFIKQ